MPRVRFYDQSYRLARVEASVELGERGFYRLSGFVSTPMGFVIVIGLKRGVRSWGKVRGRDVMVGGSGPVTRLWFMWKGVHYDRTYPRLLTHLGAARAAGRFARAIVRGAT